MGDACPLGATPECKVHHWTVELEVLRGMVLACGLKEESKWGVLCYTHNGKNVLLLSAFKEYCAISFFKGALLEDPMNILDKPGERSQAARLIRIKSIADIKRIRSWIKGYIANAIAVEEAGLKVDFSKNPEPIPQELEERLDEDPILRSAFQSLTPGRQRGYIIYFSTPKQARTRVARIDKCIGKIMQGEGLNDKYSQKK